MDKANVNGTVLEYEAQGSGEPVLLIGTGPIEDSFLPLVSEDALSASYRTITYRQRRRGDNGHGAAPVTFAEHAVDAAALLGHLAVDRAHVAGHSTGAAIALELAVGCPELVHSLALLEPPLLEAPSGGAFFEKAGPALAAYESGDREGAMERFLSMACSLDWETCKRVIDKHIPGGAARALKNADNFFESYLPALSAWKFGADQASVISQPVLSVLGTQTEQLFADSHVMLHSWFPQIEDRTIEGVAHLLHIQRPEPVARGIADFFARHQMTGL